jgi:tetratricopeptide (TPR) repeat protein
MLQGLTRRLRDWLQGSSPDKPAARASTAPAGAGTISEAASRLLERGLESLRNGQASEALARATQAIALSPEFAEAYNLAGLALRDLGRLDEAAARFQRSADIRHDYLPAINNLGMACLELERYEEAEDSFKLALAFDARSAEAHFNLGVLYWKQERQTEAIECFYRATKFDPDSAELWHSFAGLLHMAGRYDEALAAYESAQALKPEDAETHANRGLTLIKLGRFEEAAARFERALELKPAFSEAHVHLGNLYSRQDRYPAAIQCYERAVALKPDYAGAYNGLGLVHEKRGELDRALDCFHKALSLDPGDVEHHHNLGVILNALDRPRDAMVSYEQARRVQTDHPESQLNLAITQLLVGDLDRGWSGYEWRFRQTKPDLKNLSRDFPYLRWEGQPLAGKSVLVWGEQGIGDEITFSSMYSEVVEVSRSCVIECAAKLVPLFARSFPGARVVPRATPPHPGTTGHFDYQSPAGSLARWLRPAIESFPARRGHLVAAPERVAYWKNRLARLGDGLKVGFAWRSNNLKGVRALACTTPEQWGAILRVPGAHFVSLQYDECSAELARAREELGVALHAFPEVDLFNDLDEAAALTRALDLVISAPTSVSVLAAALGVPTWQMAYGADWQIHGTQRNLWYPAMTRFKRAWNQEWKEILELIAERLKLHIAQPSSAQEAPEKGQAMNGELTRGEALLRENRLHEARACFEHCVAGDPRSSAGWHGLARALQAMDRLQEAAEAYERAIGLESGHVDAALELGIVRYQQGRLEEADAAYRRVLELQPGHVGARLNRGLLNYQSGELDAAIAGYEAVLAERPEHANARFNLGLALLARGDFARGWREYEWRFDQAVLEDRGRSFPFPPWEGQDLAGKTILVWKEQSVGSQLVYAGMFPDLIARAGFCIIECTPKLVPLFARSFPDCDVVPRTEPPHPYTQHGIDYQVPIAGLGRWLRTGLETFPRHCGYLRADPARVEYWRERLRTLGAGPKIGFSWRSINTRGERALACTAIDQWGPILRTPGAHFVCLQYDECSDELELAQREFGVPVRRFSELDLFSDVDEAGALMCALDLVLSAPTAITDLSGALGVPTWQLHHATDWKMHNASYHPWFPAMRRFQRRLHQPWEEVVDEVAAELRSWIAGRGS